jgi:biopolymer transport protein ExbD
MSDKIKAQDATIIDASKERVMIRADAEVPYARFMDVINEFQTAGFYQVGLINEDIS